MPELAKFGAHVLVSHPHRIVVFGNWPLRPAVVDSPYVIRAAVALTMVAASIPGRSVVRNAEIIKWAHPRFVENLRSLGAELNGYEANQAGRRTGQGHGICHVEVRGAGDGR